MTLDLNAASKNQLRQALLAVAEERDRAERTNNKLRLIVAVLVQKNDRGAIVGPDGLLVSAVSDLPALDDNGLPELINVDVQDLPGGAGRVVVTRASDTPAPSNGDHTAKAPVLGADGRPV